MRILLPVVMLIFAASGCTHTAPLNSQHGQHKIEELSRVYPATIRLQSGGVERGYHLAIDLDSTRWRLGKTTSQTRVRASREIKWVSVSDPGRGLIEGLLIGGSVAGGAGLAFAKVAEGEPGAYNYALFIIPGIIATGVLGPVVGLVRKSRHVLVYSR